MAYGSTPTTNQTLNNGDIPLGEVYTPTGLANPGLNALQGGPGVPDTADNTRVYAPVATYTPDGNNVTHGSKADAAWDLVQASPSEVAIFKKVALLLGATSAATGGSTPYHTLSAASTNATSVKSAAVQMYGYSISNTASTVRYVKFYDKATAPTVGTDTPKHTVQIPGNGTVLHAYPEGVKFANGFAWATTTGVADTDTGAVGANDLVVDYTLSS